MMKRPDFGPMAALCTLALFAAGAARAQPAAPAGDASAEARLLRDVRQLTFEGRRAGEGYFSRDGSQMVFQSEREPGNPFYQIYLLDLETGDTQRVSPGYGKTTCAWIHPSGQRVLFASTHDDPQAREKQAEELRLRAEGKQRRYAWDYDEHFDLYAWERATGAYTRLTNARGYDAEGCYSPDGRRIVFASNRHAYDRPLGPDEAARFEHDPSYMLDLYIMDADGSNVRRLTDAPGYDGGPFFSADGAQICWRRFSEDGATAEIYVMDASDRRGAALDAAGNGRGLDASDSGPRPRAAAAERQLTHMGAMSWAPFFHPSGEYLIFTTNRHGFDNFELYLAPAAGGEPVRVTYTDGFDGLPVFSPDGKRLAWTSTRTADKQAQIFIGDWDHAAAQQLLREAQAAASRAATASAPVNGASSASAPATADRGADGFHTSPAISVDDLRLHITTLASEEFAGRLTGTEGERLATQYVADQFARLGLEPGGDDGTFFQEFAFTAGMEVEPGSWLNVAREGIPADGVREGILAPAEEAPQPQLERDWRPLTWSREGEVAPAGVVWAGYGIVAPAGQAAGQQFAEYDSFVHLDVAGRWVMVLRYMPENITPEHRQHLSRYSSLRYKAMTLRDKGAAGMIVVSGPNAGVAEQLVPIRFDASAAGGSLPVISVTDALAQRLLDASGRRLKVLQDALDDGAPQMGFALDGVQLIANIVLKRETRTGRNVLAWLRGRGTAGKPAIAIGAHVDHLGDGAASGSLARESEKGQIHYGADDNASGTAAMIEIAEHLAAQVRSGQLELKRDVLFAAWSGEELGLLGSAHFVQQVAQGRAGLPPTQGSAGVSPAAAQGSAGVSPGTHQDDPGVRPGSHQGGPAVSPGRDSSGSNDISDRFAAYLNMDMVGRYSDDVVLNGVGSSSIWPVEIERRNVPIGLRIEISEDSYLPTDATSFFLAGVPILSAFTGSHEDYHSPRDTPDKIHYEGARDVARFMALIARSLATRDEAPDYKKPEKPATQQARAGLRAYLGTIPDYGAAEIPGLKLSGVSKDAPAEQAGVRGGDVIVELAGRKIENIYDYTYAIDALKPGEETTIAVVRAGERLEFRITPGSRE